MFKGKAVIIDPETGSFVATFTETCQHKSARATVFLENPITLSGTERLAVYSTIKDQEIIAITAKDDGTVVVHEFSGESSLGCLPDKTDITLTRSPGGPLGTLLIVLGKGTIHGEHHG